MNGFYNAVTARLKVNGGYFVRPGKGDHEIWYSPVTGLRVTIPRNLVAKGTAVSILKRSGVDSKL
jgi:hypothetical protein